MTPLGLFTCVSCLQSTDKVQLLRLLLFHLHLDFALLLLLRLRLLLLLDLLALFRLLLLLFWLRLLLLLSRSTPVLLSLYLCHFRSLLLSFLGLPECLLYENNTMRHRKHLLSSAVSWPPSSINLAFCSSSTLGATGAFTCY